MKLHCTALLAAALLLALSACGPATAAPTPVPPAAAPTVQPAVPTAQPTAAPTVAPTAQPTAVPTVAPAAPTAPPSAIVVSGAWTRRSTIAMPSIAATPGSMPAMGATPGGAPVMASTAMPGTVLPNNAVYMVIKNNASVGDKLMKADFEFATAELHTVEMKDGVMDMHPVPAIDVPANGQVELKPGGFHVMLVGMKKDFAVGDKLSLKLTFAIAGTINVLAEVRAQ